MRAVVLDRPGQDPDGFRLHPDFPDPVPGPGQVLVRVAACAVNYLDLWVRRGLDRAGPFPHVCGSDVAGTVATGPEAGRRVMVHPGISCGRCRWCRAGRDSLCADHHILGVETQGGYGELVAVPEVNLFDVPEGWSDEEAAAFPLTFVTAWHGLVGVVSAVTDVLVWGATGGLGVAAVQVARALGARVAAATGTPRKAAALRALGPDLVCVGTPAEVAEQVRREMGGADVVVDPLGGEAWDASRGILRKGGLILSVGDTAGSVVQLDLLWLFLGERRAAGVYLGGLADFHDVLALARRGLVRPVVGAVLPLEDAGRAHEMVERREHFGKVVLRIS
jgi:NADPH:quinone reductase-like Zn-dependent oxidoreductase